MTGSDDTNLGPTYRIRERRDNLDDNVIGSDDNVIGSRRFLESSPLVNPSRMRSAPASGDYDEGHANSGPEFAKRPPQLRSEATMVGGVGSMSSSAGGLTMSLPAVIRRARTDSGLEISPRSTFRGADEDGNEWGPTVPTDPEDSPVQERMRGRLDQRTPTIPWMREHEVPPPKDVKDDGYRPRRHPDEHLSPSPHRMSRRTQRTISPSPSFIDSAYSSLDANFNTGDQMPESVRPDPLPVLFLLVVVATFLLLLSVSGFGARLGGPLKALDMPRHVVWWLWCIVLGYYCFLRGSTFYRGVPPNAASTPPASEGSAMENHYSSGLLNQFQLWLEHTYKTEIVWWPIPAPRREVICPPGYQKTRRLCKCGKEYIRVVRSISATPSRTVTQPPAAALGTIGTANTAARHSPSPSLSSSSGRVPRRRVYATQTPTQPLTAPVGPRSDYVLLCVDVPFSGPSLGWVLLPDRNNRSDRKFFQDLNWKYYELRGWSYVFTPFTFKMLKDIRFIRLRRYSSGTIVCSKEQQLPRGGDLDYDCDRKGWPIPPRPIEQEDLMHLFHTPDDADDVTDNDLKLLPKRVEGPIPNEDPEAWGLQAVHGPSAAMMAAFMALLVLCAATHIILWLHFHPGDYQTAWTPPGVMFAAITFAGWLLHVLQQGP